MKKKKHNTLIVFLSLFLSVPFLAIAQGGQKFSTQGNNLSTNDFLGSTNPENLVFKVDNIQEMAILTNGSIRVTSLQNGTFGLVTYDTAGILQTLAFTSGDTGYVLSQAGTWVHGSSFSQWLTNGSNIYYSAGNVGIGLSNPTYPLTVQGSALINGNLFATNVAASNTITVGTFKIVDGPTDSIVSTSSALNLASDSIMASNSLSAGTSLQGGTKGASPISISSGQITSVLGNISFANNNLTTTGTVSAGAVNTNSFATDSMHIATIEPITGDSVIKMGDGGQLIFQPLFPGCLSSIFPHPTSGCTDRIMSTCSGISFGGYSNFQNVHIGIGTYCPGATLDINSNDVGGAFIITNATTYQNAFTVDNSGNTSIAGQVVIGTGINTPAGYSLYVANGILTEKVKIAVKNSADWSDYVLGKTYKLMSLADLEKYIATNKHLPDVPSATEVQKSGIDVATMDATLLKKIEEQTLYIIQQQKELDELKAEVNQLKNK